MRNQEDIELAKTQAQIELMQYRKNNKISKDDSIIVIVRRFAFGWIVVAIFYYIAFPEEESFLLKTFPEAQEVCQKKGKVLPKECDLLFPIDTISQKSYWLGDGRYFISKEYNMTKLNRDKYTIMKPIFSNEKHFVKCIPSHHCGEAVSFNASSK